jgi:hypothetical protein
MTEKIKQITIVVGVIIVAFIGFKMFFSTDSSDQALTADKAANEDFVDGQVILVLLNKLEKVTLDTQIFSNEIFTSLVSFEKPIADQVAGRQNPFSPIGVDTSVLPGPTGTSSPLTR